MKDGEYLGFSFGSDDFIQCRKVIRSGTGEYVPFPPEEVFTRVKERLPLKERWSARHFSLDKVFEPVIIEGANVKETEWFHDISTWEGYTGFFASEESKTITRPYEGLIKRREWHGMGVEYDDEVEDKE